MEAANTLITVIGGTLIILALVAVAFIALEVVELVREFRQRAIRVGRPRTSLAELRPDDAVPLVPNRAFRRDPPVVIRAMQDKRVLQQMIEHFEGEENANDED